MATVTKSVQNASSEDAPKEVPENGFVVTAGLIQVWEDEKKKNVRRLRRGTRFLGQEFHNIPRLLKLGVIKHASDRTTPDRLTARAMCRNLGGVKDPVRNSEPMDVQAV